MTPAEPLRLLVLADLHATRDQTAPLELADAADFQRLLSSLAPAVRTEVPNLLGTTPARLDLKLELGSLRDLTPAALLELLPQARELLELLTGGSASASQLTAALAQPGLERVREAVGGSAAPVAPLPAAPAAAPAADPGGGVQRILELVDVPSASERAASAIGKVVGSIGRQRSGPGGERRSSLQTVMNSIGLQLDAILHDPQVQALEAAWRGLRLLVSRCDFRQGLRLQVMHVPRAALLGDDLLDRIRSAAEEPGFDLLLAPTQLADPAADAVVAERLAELAEELRAPLLCSLALSFFGSPTEKDELRLQGYSLEPARYLRWRALREKDPSRWLGAICNRFLLRPPYSPESREAAGLAYAESIGRDDHHLWGDPVWLLGSLAFRSYQRTGWPTEMVGSPAGRCDDLPVRVLHRGNRPPRRLAVERPLTMEQVQDLARGGFLILYGPEDADTAMVLAAPSFYHQPAPGARRGPSIGLPYQIAAGRLVRMVEHFRGQLIGRPFEEQARGLEASLSRLLAGSGPGAAVKVELHRSPEADAVPEVKLDLRVGAAVLGGVSLELRFALAD